MLFAILFVAAFLCGALIYYFSRQWWWAVATPMLVFAVNALLDPGQQGALIFTLVFGETIVFFAALLGCYVVQTRSHRGEPEATTVDSSDAKQD
ncbi:MAG: hypothetical protein HKN50_01695 [Gammaproteobacteria bacterium]|nr:hypothetical protein [Gammaproteobacteria bacterium]